MPTTPPPLIGVTACLRPGDGSPFHRVGAKYVSAVSEVMGACPVLIPALETGINLDLIVSRLDGILFTGSPSNIDPVHYDGDPQEAEDDVYGVHDPARDAVTLPLIRAAVEVGVPVLGLCRGIQEFNVAFGGSLLDRIQDDPKRLDHRMRRDVDGQRRYRPAHTVSVTPGGLLERMAGPGPHLVNSLHGQAIDRPADRIVVEGVAPDGIIEAVSVRDAKAFALAVQWHPEWPRPVEGINKALFEAFRDAADRYAAERKPAREHTATDQAVDQPIKAVS